MDEQTNGITDRQTISKSSSCQTVNYMYSRDVLCIKSIGHHGKIRTCVGTHFLVDIIYIVSPYVLMSNLTQGPKMTKMGPPPPIKFIV